MQVQSKFTTNLNVFCVFIEVHITPHTHTLFYMYTLCTYYYPCKLCLYDSRSVSLLMMNWLSCCTCFFFRFAPYVGLCSKPGVWVHPPRPCKVYTAFVIIICWCVLKHLLHDTVCNYMALTAAGKCVLTSFLQMLSFAWHKKKTPKGLYNTTTILWHLCASPYLCST